MRGGNVYDLMELLGHADMETTTRYAHLAPEHLRAKSAMVSFKTPVLGNVISLIEELPQPYGNHGEVKSPHFQSLTEPLTNGIVLKSDKIS